MRYSIDEDAQILHVDMAAGAAEKLLSTTLALIGDRPELCGWDWIVEGRPLPDDATADHLARLAQSWGPPPTVGAVTVFVAHDPLLHLWAKVMDFQFARRKHLVTRELEEARRLIDRRRAPCPAA